MPPDARLLDVLRRALLAAGHGPPRVTSIEIPLIQRDYAQGRADGRTTEIRARFGELFTVISEQLKAGKPHDPASIGATLAEAGKSAGSHHGALLRFALTQATLSGAAAEFAGHYAQMVMSAAYRRGFHAAAASMTQAAAELPKDQLFAHLLSIGRQQRTATQRLARINGALSDTLPGGVIGETGHDIVKEPQ